MELIHCLENRRSVREFQPEDVPDDVIMEALRYANLAPSAGNMQARDFIVIRKKGTREKLAKLSGGQGFIATAPLCIVACTNSKRSRSYGERGDSLYSIMDVAAAVENMLLFLFSRGYGTCWVGAFDEEGIRELLDVPEFARPVAIIPVGRPKDTHAPHPRQTMSPRMNLETLVHKERWTMIA